MEIYIGYRHYEVDYNLIGDAGPVAGKKIKDFDKVKSIVLHTSHHTHYVIGTGSGDPQKMDPNASRETLDHSIMYIFAVALQDGEWHHVRSYAPERAKRGEAVLEEHRAVLDTLYL